MKLSLLFLLLFTRLACFGQDFHARQVSGLPTEVVYDLLADSRGFIWVGHAQGLSRYDGLSFTHFDNRQQTTLGATDLVEDRQGRIWCHNFNGQVFYVENEQMKLFDAYKASEESGYPRMQINGDDLFITSDRGLFICHTPTLSFRYLTDTLPDRSKTIAIAGQKAVTFDGQHWMGYQKDDRLKELSFVNASGTSVNPSSITLYPLHLNNRLYGYNNFLRQVFEMRLEKEQVVLKKVLPLEGVVNTLSETDEKVWIHTKLGSFTAEGGQTIMGYNLTDKVTDKEGNNWYGSLQAGLLFEPRYQWWKKVDGIPLYDHDFIRCIKQQSSATIYGTQHGKIWIKKEDGKTTQAELPSVAGAVEKMFLLPNGTILIAPSLGMYLLDPATGQLHQLSVISTVNGIDFKGDTVFIAYPLALSSISLRPDNRAPFLQPGFTGSSVDSLSKAVSSEEKSIGEKCFAVAFNPSSRLLYAAFKNGLSTVQGRVISPVFYKGQKLFTSSLLVSGTRVYAATFGNGLMILQKDSIRKISAPEGLFSDVILKMKLFGSHLYLVESKGIQVWDTEKERIIASLPLPGDLNGSVYDVLEDGQGVLLATASGLYRLPMSRLQDQNYLKTYLLFVKTGSRDLTGFNAPELSYDDNSIRFRLAAPSYVYPHSTYFMYRLKGGSDTSWQKTEPGVSSVSFESLRPGQYLFEAYAINFQNQRASKPITFRFNVNKPWWQENWFYLLMAIILLFIAWNLARMKIKMVRKENRLALERLQLQDELRQSLLNTIKAQMNPHFIFNALNTIQSFVYADDKEKASAYLGKFSDLIRKVLEGSSRQSVRLDEEIELLRIYLDIEKARYDQALEVSFYVDPLLDTQEFFLPSMLVQPYIENALRHGLLHKKGLKKLTVSFIRQGTEGLEIKIEDNGIGRQESRRINANRVGHKSFATSANERRLELINQLRKNKIILQIIDKEDIADSGTIIILTIPLKNQ
jgi:hypothetical protein